MIRAAVRCADGTVASKAAARLVPHRRSEKALNDELFMLGASSGRPRDGDEGETDHMATDDWRRAARLHRAEVRSRDVVEDGGRIPSAAVPSVKIIRQVGRAPA